MATVTGLTGSAIYESPGAVSEYLLFHFGDTDAILGGLPGPVDALGFARRIVTELSAEIPGDAKALDVGCAVGATAFELSKSCASVTGIDFSSAFVEAAMSVQCSGQVSGIRRLEGQKTDAFVASLDPEARPDRVAFEVGDACALRADLGTFDVVVAANLICRLPDPMAFLNRLPDLVRSGGQLILTTPFTWMEEYTPVEKWLGARPDSEFSFEVLTSVLEPHFSLEFTKDLPFLIREHRRKFQYSVALGSRWRRR